MAFQIGAFQAGSFQFRPAVLIASAVYNVGENSDRSFAISHVGVSISDVEPQISITESYRRKIKGTKINDAYN